MILIQAMRATWTPNRTVAIIIGVVYTLIGLLGLIPVLYFPVYGNDNGRFLSLTHLSVADHVLHIVLGLIALVIGFYLIGARGATRRAARL